MRMNRRDLLTTGIAGTAMLGTSLVALPALALTADEAKAHVKATIDELLALLRTPGSARSRTPRLREIMEARADLPRIAQFCAGRIWREMSPDQQKRYVEAFTEYVSTTYARRFSDYAGDPKIQIGRSIDAGQKGFLVETPITMDDGQSYGVSWLVSDRGGNVDITDIVIEGISMVATQRDEIATLFQQSGQNVDALIDKMSSLAAGA